MFLKFNTIKKTRNETDNYPELSVIIAAKNESDNLLQHLPLILKQDYQKFEVIVVDDSSTDDTNISLNLLSKQFEHLEILKISDEMSNKKRALNLGINHAKYELLVFTDADCYPQSDQWLKLISSVFLGKSDLVLGYSPYRRSTGELNALIRFETTLTAINYFGFAKLGLAYMGVGRNLAYTKNLFHSVKGYNSHKHIASGDDDLLVRDASQHHTIGICLHPDSFMTSLPKMNFKSWINQKRRHVSTSHHYRSKIKLLLGFQYINRLLFWVFVIPFGVYYDILNQNFPIFTLSIVFVMLSKWILIKTIFYTLGEDDLWLKYYIYELFLVFIQFYIFIYNIVSPKKNW